MSLISIKKLTISFKANQNVVNDVNIEIPKGKTVAIVGESGSGKTLSALSILKLLPGNANINSGSIIFEEKDLLKLLESRINGKPYKFPEGYITSLGQHNSRFV